MFGGAAAQFVSRFRVVGASLGALTGRVAVLGAVHVQGCSGQLWGSSSGVGQRVRAAATLDEDFGHSSVGVSGAAWTVVVPSVPVLAGGSEVSRGGV